ncbi:putative cytosol aminopeptidase [Austwickia sp. TVS 96-490-7B]|uniref:leucyl aminopeptidase n=1 Tax=Austwickia sp. TVS 96-490-7B TaxID=2830843 RepID=UPI001C56A911|nr:leucyl aminopeptidase [Austwickia sp. TVS 96-490-7B]MBW3086402.1 putative cytosol aminopeptidase [Austwickia sp. TVS 96-490-7B]
MTSFTLSAHAAHEEDAEVLVVFTASVDDRAELLGDIAEPVRQAVSAAAQTVRARGTADEVVPLPGVAGLSAPSVLLTGLGERKGDVVEAERWRRAAGVAARATGGREKVAVLLPAGDAATMAAITEGFALGAYAFTAHRATTAAKAARSTPVAEVVLVGAADVEGAASAIHRAEVLAQGVHWARDLVNTPPNMLVPMRFAERARQEAPAGVQVTIHDADALAEQHCGGILGVGQGSENPPAIVHLAYAPEGAKGHLSYVGKGVTFDSGGLSLKPADGMVDMKCDMAGAAAVAAAVYTIARLGLPIAVDGWLCLAENMPGGRAQRPGDIVTMADGSTCEVINTDAEGRLILADGLVLASRRRPDVVVDVATLTGAAIVALGKRTAAIMSNNDAFRAELAQVAAAGGESMWPMPIPEEIAKGLESPVADRKHHGDRSGGASLAAAFLREYVGVDAQGNPQLWGHLDIAGPAYNDDQPHGYTPRGGTGFAVRTLVGLAESRS